MLSYAAVSSVCRFSARPTCGRTPAASVIVSVAANSLRGHKTRLTRCSKPIVRTGSCPPCRSYIMWRRNVGRKSAAYSATFEHIGEGVTDVGQTAECAALFRPTFAHRWERLVGAAVWL